ncbi:MAG: hypothetical protein ACW99G_20355 [Candidatus Thorarchaeota archaeon]|jgi:hypothetical protein
MKIIDILPRQICISIEFSEEEIRGLLVFLEKAMPLYAKVYLDSDASELSSEIENIYKELKSVIKAIKSETEDGFGSNS